MESLRLMKETSEDARYFTGNSTGAVAAELEVLGLDLLGRRQQLAAKTGRVCSTCRAAS